jgi:hypothetical protein
MPNSEIEKNKLANMTQQEAERYMCELAQGKVKSLQGPEAQAEKEIRSLSAEYIQIQHDIGNLKRKADANLSQIEVLSNLLVAAEDERRGTKKG